MDSLVDQMDVFKRIFERILKNRHERRIAIVCPTIVSMACDFIHKAMKSAEISQPESDWYTYMIQLCINVSNTKVPGTAVQLLLKTAISASEDAGLELLAYECFEQAFLLFEDSIPDSKQENNLLYSIINSLYTCHIFEEENRDTLAHKASSYCSKLLRRKDQCLAVLACSHIFWQEGEGKRVVQDGRGVMASLKKALRIAHAAQQQGVLLERASDESTIPGHLFVDILNSYVYYYDKGVPGISAETVNQVIELAASEVHSDVCKSDVQLQSFFQKTIQHIAAIKEQEGADSGLMIPET